jgi:CheY-like chemotaxis protein
LEKEAFDLIFMDVQMPEMDGLAAIEAIRARERQTRGHIRIIAMTAHAMKGDRDRCLKAGTDGYVSKPISRDAQMGAIERSTAFSGRSPGLARSVEHSQEE